MNEYVLVTCEHGGNRVPPRYSSMFHGLRGALNTHRGYDFGALSMARELALAFAAPLVASEVTRLLVDLNRSTHHPRLHSQAVRDASREKRVKIIADYYLPYRKEVERLIRNATKRGRRVIHISAHSFTPELNGKRRTADVGLLYDPARPGEVRLAERWKTALKQAAPESRVRRNYPYAGKDDGFMPYLRGRYRPAQYVGIELEVNQAIILQAPRRWAGLRTSIIASLRAALA